MAGSLYIRLTIPVKKDIISKRRFFKSMEKRCLQQEYGGDTGMSSCFNEVGPCDLLACLMIERLTERGIDPSALDVYTIRDRALFHTDCDVHLEKPEYGEKFRRRHLKRKS